MILVSENSSSSWRLTRLLGIFSERWRLDEDQESFQAEYDVVMKGRSEGRDRVSAFIKETQVWSGAFSFCTVLRLCGYDFTRPYTSIRFSAYIQLYLISRPT